MVHKPHLIAVIHYESDAQVLMNARRAINAQFDGVMLINMVGKSGMLPSIGKSVKKQYPNFLVGINFLEADPLYAFYTNLANGLDMTWTDQQLTHSSKDITTDVESIARGLAVHPEHHFFTGVGFKYQPHEPNPGFAARRACDLNMIATTSGPATGKPANAANIGNLKRSMKMGTPLAIASGITPDNVKMYTPHVSYILVASGVSSDFHNLDPDKLRALYNNVHH